MRRALAVVTVALAALLHPAAATAADPNLDTLVKQFSAVAFEHEYGGDHRAGRLIKWRAPIRVQLRGLGADRYRPEVEAQLRTLSELTGLPIALQAWWEVVGAPELEVNFVIYPPKAPGQRPVPCAARLRDQDFAIRRAEIYIASDVAEIRKHCIAEEITQALGLANDSKLIADSIFNDASGRSTLSTADALILRTLYDPRLRAGMTREEALPLARTILAELIRARRAER